MAGAECCQNPPALDATSGEGRAVENLEGCGLKAYVAGNLDSSKAIVLVSDIFGYEAPNLRRLADKVAANGFCAVVPDFLYGDPFVPDVPSNPLPEWLKSHSPAKGFEDAKSVVAALKSKGVSVIGCVGFCWGAKVIIGLAKSNLIQAAVMIHPSLVTVDDIKEVIVPISILGAENDKISPPELVKEFETILSTKSEVDSYVKIFPEVAHGWSCRYDATDEAAAKKAEEAHQDMLEWFMKYVK